MSESDINLCSMQTINLVKTVMSHLWQPASSPVTLQLRICNTCRGLHLMQRHWRWSCFLHRQFWCGGHLYRTLRWDDLNLSSFDISESHGLPQSQAGQDSPRLQNQLNNVEEICCIKHWCDEFHGGWTGPNLWLWGSQIECLLFRFLNLIKSLNTLEYILRYQLNLPVTEMLRALLLRPSPSSHQYSPLSDEKAGVMVPDPADVSQLEMFVGVISWSVLITLHSAEPPNSQLKEMNSYSKNCSLFGRTRRKAAPETQNTRN